MSISSTKQSLISSLAVILITITAASSESGERISVRKENNQMSVAAYGSDKQNVDKQPVKCSICNSMSTEGLSAIEIRRMGAAGDECITNPKKFVQNCDQWRLDYSFDHPLNKTVQFTGCYKTVFTYEHDIEGNEKEEERVVRSCGFLGTPGCYNAPGYGTNQKICFCTGAECNGSAGLVPGAIVLFSLIVSSILLRN